jgi:hypothetical protein
MRFFSYAARGAGAGLLACAGSFWLCLSPAPAAEYRVTNATDLKSRTALLQPGDTLTAAPGTYTLTTWDITVSGARTNWITIRGESNVVIKGTSTGANVIQFQNAHYVNFTGFEVISTAPASAGIDGVNIRGTATSHITFDRLNIHGMGNNGISIFATEASFITLRNSVIASNAVCGLYWGYPARDVVHDVLVENNYIHHCPSNSASATGYGIQFKGGCYRGRFVDNVLHDVGGTSRSGLIVYYGKTNPKGDVPDDMNIVRGNVLWNCRNEGITAMADALVENNIVFDAVTGINLQTYTDELGGPNYAENLVVRNNTAFRCSSSCLTVPTSNWSSIGSNVCVTGNAAYRTSSTQAAISGSGGAARLSGNVRFGTSGLSSGAIAGNGLSDFLGVTASAVATNLNFYPSANSALTNKIASAQDWPETDFNGTARPYGVAVDAGAYERVSSANPGGAIRLAAKPVIPPASPVIRQFDRVNGTNYFIRWPRTVKWTQVEFARTLDVTNWLSLAGPVYATNITVAPPASSTNGFIRLRLE